MLEWVAISVSRGSSPPRDQTHVSCIAGIFFTAKPPRKPYIVSRYYLLDWPKSSFRLLCTILWKTWMNSLTNPIERIFQYYTFMSINHNNNLTERSSRNQKALILVLTLPLPNWVASEITMPMGLVSAFPKWRLCTTWNSIILHHNTGSREREDDKRSQAGKAPEPFLLARGKIFLSPTSNSYVDALIPIVTVLAVGPWEVIRCSRGHEGEPSCWNWSP